MIKVKNVFDFGLMYSKVTMLEFIKKELEKLPDNNCVSVVWEDIAGLKYYNLSMQDFPPLVKKCTIRYTVDPIAS